jgi:hypothetical protein
MPVMPGGLVVKSPEFVSGLLYRGHGLHTSPLVFNEV